MGDDELETGAVGKPMTGMEVRLINWDEGNYKVTDRPYPRGEIVFTVFYLSSKHLERKDLHKNCLNCLETFCLQ